MSMAVPPGTEIVVTGKALSAPLGSQVLSISTITRDDIDRSATTQLDQLLKSIPGLELFRRSDARSGHPTSQGFTLRALGGTGSSRALLLLDGVPQSDPFGGWVNWPTYDPAEIGRIRVTRGGGSVSFGPGALAGVVELDSRSPGGAVQGEVGVASRRSIEGRASAGIAMGGGRLQLGGRYGSGNGFIPIVPSQRGMADRPAPYQEGSLRARFVRPLSTAVETQFSGSIFSDRRERGLDFTTNRSRGADLSLRLVGRGRLPWSGLIYGQWRGLESSFANVDAARSKATRVSLQDDVPSEAVGASFEVRPRLEKSTELRLGGDVRRMRGHSHEFYSYTSGEPTRQRDSGGKAATFGLFGEAARTIGPVTLTAGARVDHWVIEDGLLIENLLANGTVLTGDRYVDRSGWLPTARAGGSVALTKLFSVRTAAYLGWRLPTLNELFRPFRAGADATAANPLLDPERSKGAEFGARYGDSADGIEATLFSNRLEHPIANITLGMGPRVFPGVGFVAAGGTYRQRQNSEGINVRGIELDGWLKRGSWSVRAGYSYANARTQSGLRPAQTPMHSANATIGWDRGPASLALTARYTGAQYEDDFNFQKLAPATSFDAFAAIPLRRRLQVVFRGENLLNERIEAGVGSNGTVEHATPRSLSIGLRLID